MFRYRDRLHAVHWDVTRHPDGKYSAYIVASTSKETLNLGTVIGCELRISGTGYVKIGRVLYYSGGTFYNYY